MLLILDLDGVIAMDDKITTKTQKVVLKLKQKTFYILLQPAEAICVA